MNRTEEFIGRCLRDVPPGRYRRRADAELKDHMECQRQVATEEETLEAMGDPERLRREYYAAWSRTLPGRVNLIVNCYLLIWGVTFLSAGLLEALRLGGKPAWLIGLYLLPFTLGAAFLGACLRGERRRALGVTLALLMEWVLTNLTFFLLSLWLYDISGELADVLRGAAPYLLLTFTGCLILGQLFGRKNERRGEPA